MPFEFFLQNDSHPNCIRVDYLENSSLLSTYKFPCFVEEKDNDFTYRVDLSDRLLVYIDLNMILKQLFEMNFEKLTLEGINSLNLKQLLKIITFIKTIHFSSPQSQICIEELLKEDVSELNIFSDRRLLERLIYTETRLLFFAKKELAFDFELNLLAVKLKPHFIKFVDQESTNFLKIAYTAIFLNPESIQFIKIGHSHYFDLAIYAISRNPKVWILIDHDIKFQKKFLLEALPYYLKCLENLPESLLNDEEFFKQAVKINPLAITFSGEAVKKNRVIAEIVLAKKGALLEKLGHFQNDLEMAEIAIENHFNAFQFVSPDLKMNHKLCDLVLQYSPSAIKNFNPSMDDYKKFALLALSKDAQVWKWIDQSLRKDEKFRLDALSFTLSSLNILPLELLNNKEFFKQAIAINPKAILYGGQEIINSRELAQDALTKDGLLLEHLPKFQDDDKIVSLAVTSNVLSLEFASDRLKRDERLVKFAIAISPYAFLSVNKFFRLDRDLALSIVSRCGALFFKLSEELQNDREIYLTAIRQNPEILKPVTRRIYDREILMAALEKDGVFIRYADKSLLDKEVILKALERDPLLIKDNCYDFKSKLDEEMMLFAIKINHHAFTYTHPELLHRDFILKAIRANYRVFGLIDHSFKLNREFLIEVYKIHPKLSKELLEILNRETLDSIIRAAFDQIIQNVRIHEPRILSTKKFVSSVFEIFEMVCDEIKNYKNTDLQDHIAFIFFNDFSIDRLVRMIQYLPTYSMAQFRDLALGLLILDHLNLPTEHFQQVALYLAQHHKELKESHRYQALLGFLKAVDQAEIGHEEKKAYILQSLEGDDDFKKEKVLLFRFLKIWLDFKRGLFEIKHFSSVWLAQELLNELIVDGFVPKYIDNYLLKFLTKFFESPSPCAIFAFASFHKQDVKIAKLIKKMIHLVLEDQMISYRNSNNSHAHLLNPQQLEIWQQSQQFALKRGGAIICDTDEFMHLFLSGTQILGSCLNVFGNNEINKALLSIIFDGKIRMIAVMKSGIIVSRSFIKLMNCKGDPVLFLEEIYPYKDHEDVIQTMAFEKAQRMGVKLYQSKGFGKVILRSEGNHVQFEYTDAGPGLTDGSYSVPADEIICNRPLSHFI